jgi:hypothetical protein
MPEPDPTAIARARVHANVAAFYLDDGDGSPASSGLAIHELRQALALLGATPDPGIVRRLNMSLDAFGTSVSAPVATADLREILALLGPPAPEGDD